MTSDDPALLGLKFCRACKGHSSQPYYTGAGCDFCKNTGLVEDLRKWGYCEGSYFSHRLFCGHEGHNIDKHATACRDCAWQAREEEMAKAKIPEPSEEHLAVAASSAFMSQLLHVAEAYARGSSRGPFVAALPGLFGGWVAEKNGYRQITIKAGSRFDIHKVSIGKKAGLLFCFKPIDAQVSEKDHPEWIELTWDDLINTFGDLADAVDADLILNNHVEVGPTNDKLKETIARNPAMHKILTVGFERAHHAAAGKAEQDRLASHPDWATF